MLSVDGVVLLTVRGEIDIATGAAFAGALDQALAGARRAVELDLGEVTHFGSEGIRRLLQARLAARRRRIELRVACISDRARQVLEITDVAGMLDLPTA